MTWRSGSNGFGPTAAAGAAPDARGGAEEEVPVVEEVVDDEPVEPESFCPVPDHAALVDPYFDTILLN